MKVRLAITVALATFATVPVAVAAAAGPSPSQIKTALARATHSRTLWATINVCDTARHPDQIGVRGQMPALGFPAQLQMTVRLSYWDFTTHRFVRIPHVSKTLALGTATHGTVQDGVSFRFAPPVILSGAITFQWRSGRAVLASVTRQTSGGDRGVDDGDPRGASAATCSMGE
jgi:hypothetical protein